MEKNTKAKKGFFPKDIKTNLILIIGGWCSAFIIDALQLEGGIPAIIGGVGAFAFLGGLIGLILIGARKLMKK